MRGVRDFLIQGKEMYESRVGEIELSHIFCDPFQRMKSAPVIGNPIIDIGFSVREGELIFFDHIIFEELWLNKNSLGPEKQDSQFLIDRSNDIYRVPANMVYAYTKNGNLEVTDNYVIVEPIVMEDQVDEESGIIEPGFEKEVEGIGKIVHIGKKLSDMGYKVGDHVIWDANSEYEVRINNKKYYRMDYEWIIAKYEV